MDYYVSNSWETFSWANRKSALLSACRASKKMGGLITSVREGSSDGPVIAVYVGGRKA